MAAQYLGAGEIAKCARVVTQGLVMTLMSAPFLTLITFLVAGIFEGMGHEPEQVELVERHGLSLPRHDLFVEIGALEPCEQEATHQLAFTRPGRAVDLRDGWG